MPSRSPPTLPQDHLDRMRPAYGRGTAGHTSGEALHLPRESGPVTQLGPDAVGPSILHLRCAGGQPSAVIRMLEAGREYEDVTTQIAVVSRVIDRAGYSTIAHGTHTRLLDDPAGESTDTQKLEKLFLDLS